MPKRRRRSFTPQFKAQVVLEVLSGTKSQAEVARQQKLKPQLIARWKEITLEGRETGWPCSSVYHDAAPAADEGRLRRAPGRLAARCPTYGYRRMTAMLRRE